MDDNNKSETESKKGSKKSRKDKKDRRRNSGKYQFHKLQRKIADPFFFFFHQMILKTDIAKAKFLQVLFFFSKTNFFH